MGSRRCANTIRSSAIFQLHDEPSPVRAVSIYYFRYVDGLQIPNRAGILPGIDIRGDGGFIVAPPSLHISGNRYEWIG